MIKFIIGFGAVLFLVLCIISILLSRLYLSQNCYVQIIAGDYVIYVKSKKGTVCYTTNKKDLLHNLQTLLEAYYSEDNPIILEEKNDNGQIKYSTVKKKGVGIEITDKDGKTAKTIIGIKELSDATIEIDNS